MADFYGHYLSRDLHLYKAISENNAISKGQQHRLVPPRVRRGQINQFWALGAMASCECVEGWGRVLEHVRHLWPSLNG